MKFYITWEEIVKSSGLVEIAVGKVFAVQA